MFFTADVDIPEEVVLAHAEGRLVFFVGAGVSVDPPSSLPQFGGLAEQLARSAVVPYDADASIDSFLGSFPENFDTHRHTHTIINNPESRPNGNHAAIARLAAACPNPRIVTTNFDTHLSTAVEELGIESLETWSGPALPLGDDFTGIVHLHGSIRRSPNELILTDKDFGAAYLTRGWATRFLVDMFRTFTVLFVGYSHDDPIMAYLGLGLPSDAHRFALLSTPNNDTKQPDIWERLNVTRRVYPVMGHDHTALTQALDAWARRARMGRTDHRARMGDIVIGGPTLSPVDRDYVLSRLRTSEGADDFARAIHVLENDQSAIAWLRWLEDLPGFRASFDDTVTAEPIPALENLFAAAFIAGSPERNIAALRTVQQLGQRFTAELASAAWWAAGHLAESNPDAERRWEVLLATSIGLQSTHRRFSNLTHHSPEAVTGHPATLRVQLTPHLVLRASFGLFGDAALQAPRAEVAWDVWEDQISGRIERAIETTEPGDPGLSALLTDALDSAYDLLDGYYGEQAWDSLSHSRSAIEPHEQNREYGAHELNALVDGLRTFGAKALPVEPGITDTWWGMRRPLFQRLAIHLLAEDRSRSADQKIDWLLDRSCLYETSLKHETYRVLRNSVGDASASIKKRLLAMTLRGPDAPDDLNPEIDREEYGRHVAYTIYNLLLWLTLADPEWAEAADAFDEAQHANREFGPRDHPDFDNWMSSGSWGWTFPFTIDEYTTMLGDDPASAITKLLEIDYDQPGTATSSWHEATMLVSRVVQQHPELGLDAWQAIVAGLESDTRTADLLGAVIDGWSKVDPTGVTSEALSCVATMVDDPDRAEVIGRFLDHQIRERVNDDESADIALLREIAKRLWDTHGTSFTHGRGEDLMSRVPLYLNSWPGHLSQFWLMEIDRRWRHHGDDWGGLVDEEKAALEALLNGPSDALDAVEPGLASSLFFLFSADPTFTKRRLLPLFADPERAPLLWYAYLHNPRCNDALLESGLLNAALDQWGRLDQFNEDTITRNFFDLILAIVSFSGISTEQRSELLTRSVTAGDQQYAAAFATETARFLTQESVDGAEVWASWLRCHIEHRIDGIPRDAKQDELEAWADCVPGLGSAIRDGVELFRTQSVGLTNEHWLAAIESLDESSGADLVAFYIHRLGHTVEADWSVYHRVRRIISALRAVIGDVAVEPLINAARERGYDLGNG